MRSVEVALTVFENVTELAVVQLYEAGPYEPVSMEGLVADNAVEVAVELATSSPSREDVK
jgi:hypothetical protein